MDVLQETCRKHLEEILMKTAKVEAEYPTPQGIVCVRHEKMEDGSVNTEVSAPLGVEILIVREDAK